ncbi:hypothetical protein [Halorubrum sp. CBA1125]|uniref:hypothetical protein n=1 Tax=Halorubrum sp. CBA1125 TaxID=2668072 RepID=UPI001E2AD097|nr:hypothetical protein [Halorubrum sp. CBA1125]
MRPRSGRAPERLGVASRGLGVVDRGVDAREEASLDGPHAAGGESGPRSRRDHVQQRRRRRLDPAVGGEKRRVSEPVLDDDVDPAESRRDPSGPEVAEEPPGVRPPRERDHFDRVPALAEAVAEPPVVVEAAGVAVDTPREHQSDAHYDSSPV